MAKLQSYKHVDNLALDFSIPLKWTKFHFYTRSWVTNQHFSEDFVYMYGKGFEYNPGAPLKGGRITAIEFYNNNWSTSKLSNISIATEQFYLWKEKSNTEIAVLVFRGGDQLFGGSKADKLSGLSGADSIYGGAGSDTLLGGSGNDTISGGRSKDTLTGGSGRDQFVFDVRPSVKEYDTIKDFSVTSDTICLNQSLFDPLLTPGVLSQDAFRLGASAESESDRIIYNRKNGFIYWDPDGVGEAQQIAFAKVGKYLNVTAADFLIF